MTRASQYFEEPLQLYSVEDHDSLQDRQRQRQDSRLISGNLRFPAPLSASLFGTRCVLGNAAQSFDQVAFPLNTGYHHS